MTLKQQVYQQLQQLVEEKIDTANKAIQAVIESRDNETKSSVGDKYETGRAMMQMEQQQNEIQLSKAVLQQQQLQQIKIDKSYDKVEQGSLVTTNRGVFFMSIGLGKLIIKEKVIYAISLQSPIGQVLRDGMVGQKIQFQGKELVIVEIS